MCAAGTTRNRVSPSPAAFKERTCHAAWHIHIFRRLASRPTTCAAFSLAGRIRLLRGSSHILLAFDPAAGRVVGFITAISVMIKRDYSRQSRQ